MKRVTDDAFSGKCDLHHFRDEAKTLDCDAMGFHQLLSPMETRCFMVPAASAAFCSPSTPQMFADRWHSRTLCHSWVLLAVLWLFGLGSLARADSFAMTSSLAIGRGEPSATLLPTVESIAPANGTSFGGTNVTISGTDFTGATGVTIGGNAATNLSVVNATTITCTTPSGSAGAASVVVTTPLGANASNTLYTYFMVPPIIVVRGNSNSISSGDTTPSTSDGTDFGSVALSNTQVSHLFVIINVGNMPLNLSGSPLVAVSGPAAADFKVPEDPATSLPFDSSTWFSLIFDPSLPGQRTATVTIASNDPATPSFSFDVTGIGVLPAKLAQTITFAPPATLYLGQSPYTLSASSNWGLPVTLSLVAPIPAGTTLVNNVLTATTAGTVKVQAASPASGDYAAAVTVLKSIVVKANPTPLTLINLNQMYDGMPKPIATLGGTGTPAITYKVGTAYVSNAPTAAGSYPVKAVAGIATVTGTLVIAKAPLYVTPDDKHKFAGQVNPALTVQYSGFVNGETSAAVTKAPALATTATTTSIAGDYPITASGATALNYSFVYRPGTMVVDSFAASYEALLFNIYYQPVGKLSVTVPATNTTFTAKLYTVTETAPVSFTGALVSTVNQATGTATTTVVVNKLSIPYVINFTLPAYGQFSASVTRLAIPLGWATDGQRLSSAPVNFAGAHTALLEPATPTSAIVPAGAGWATVSASSAGILSFAGQLGDGTAFTAALSPDALANPGYRMFVQPYVTARTQSFIAGNFSLSPHPTLANRRYLMRTGMYWQKTGLANDVSYRSNFGPVNIVLMMDPWLPPAVATKTTPAVSLAQRLGLTGNSFNISHSDTGSASQGDLPTQLALSAANAVSVVTPLANKTKWKTLTFLPTTGTFTGGFEVTDTVNSKPLIRPVTFSGVMRQPATGTDPLIGDGHYVLPSESGTEKTTGEVRFTRP